MKFQGKLITRFQWVVPLVLGVSVSNVDNKAVVYALHITPFFEIGVNRKLKNNG